MKWYENEDSLTGNSNSDHLYREGLPRLEASERLTE